MTEIFNFVISCISSCFTALNHFVLESNGLISFYDILLVLLILRIILYIKAYIQSTTEIESNEFTNSKNSKRRYK